MTYTDSYETNKALWNDTQKCPMCRKGWQQPIRAFDAKRGFRQGDSLSCDFFNILMEKIICAAGLRHTGTIFYKSIMALAYADDVDIIGRSICEVEAAFSKFAEEARSIGLALRARQSCFYQQLRILA